MLLQPQNSALTNPVLATVYVLRMYVLYNERVIMLFSPTLSEVWLLVLQVQEVAS